MILGQVRLRGACLYFQAQYYQYKVICRDGSNTFSGVELFTVAASCCWLSILKHFFPGCRIFLVPRYDCALHSLRNPFLWTCFTNCTPLKIILLLHPSWIIATKETVTTCSAESRLVRELKTHPHLNPKTKCTAFTQQPRSRTLVLDQEVLTPAIPFFRRHNFIYKA